MGGWSALRPDRFAPGKDLVPIVQGRSGRVRKISPQTEFDPRTVQPVASRYTDRAIPARNRNEYQGYFLGGKGGRCVGLTTLPPYYADCLEVWKPASSGSVRVCTGTASPLL
jgi:hypothetical protein